jgi:hypothetical protein
MFVWAEIVRAPAKIRTEQITSFIIIICTNVAFAVKVSGA